MKTIRSRSFAATLAALSLAPGAARAAAVGSAGGGGGVTTTTNQMGPLCNEAPSATTCADGRYQTCAAYCASNGPCSVAHTTSECGPILDPQFTTGVAQAQAQLAAGGQPTSKPVILPGNMSQLHGVAPGTLFGALPIASNAISITSAGTGASFRSAMMSGDFVDAMLSPRYPVQEIGSQLTMNDCAEYVWKKWGTVSQVDDAAHVAGTNWDWVVQALQPSSYVNLSLTYAMRRDNLPISLNGTTITFPPTVARNVFYSAVPYWLAGSADPTQQTIYQAINALATQPSISVGTADEGWANGQLRRMQMAGVSDANFDDNERRMAAYAPLVQQLQTDQAALDNFSCHSYYCRSIMLALQAAVQKDQQAITSALVAEWTYDARNGCFGYSYPLQGYNPNVTVNACDWTPHQFVQTYIDILAPQKEAAYARCIADTGDNWSALKSPATTSPPLFGGATPFMHDYSHNLTRGSNDQTTDQVPANATADQTANATSVEQYFWDYEHQDLITKQIQTEQGQASHQFMVATTSLPLQGAPPGTAGQVTYIGQQKQDSDSVGGSWFGGGYNYWAGWSITPRVEDPAYAKAAYPNDSVPHICALTGDAGASMKVWATVLTEPITILDAALEVTAQPPALGSTTNYQQPGSVTLKQAHLTILDNVFNNGQDYLAQPLSKAGLKEGSTWSGSSFDYPITATPVDQGFSTIIPILFIPVQVGAGLTVHVGTEFKGSALPPVYCDRNNVGFSMNTSVSPTAEVDGKVWVAIDLGIASAGIEGDLTVFKGGLPITGSISLSSAATNDPNQISLVINTAASLSMTELSGKVDLYAEVLGNRADVSLFSWPGFTQNPPLWNLTQTYPLVAVNYRLNPTSSNVELGQ